MSLTLLCLLAFLTSIPTAWAWAKYIPAVAEGRAIEAAFWDVLIVALGQVALLSLWSESGESIAVLLSGMAGGALGTYLTVRRAKKV